MSETLPDYERHPLDETVMGVQFDPLKSFGIKHLFHYWSSVKDRYPNIEEQAILAHAIEQPAIEPRKEAGKLIISGLPSPVPMSRFLLVDASGNHLIQIQNDRFLRNWRRRDGSESYPRFDGLFSSFLREWEGFRAFLKDEKIDEPKIDQCELIYVNFIDVNDLDGGLSGISDAFSVLHKQTKKGFLPTPEIMKWESAYSMPGGRGRLHVSAAPSFRQRDFKLIINFTLTARGKPLESSEQLTSWFMMSHEWIVRAFDELTTPVMHKIWKKKT